MWLQYTMLIACFWVFSIYSYQYLHIRSKLPKIAKKSFNDFSVETTVHPRFYFFTFVELLSSKLQNTKLVSKIKSQSDWFKVDVGSANKLHVLLRDQYVWLIDTLLVKRWALLASMQKLFISHRDTVRSWLTYDRSLSLQVHHTSRTHEMDIQWPSRLINKASGPFLNHEPSDKMKREREIIRMRLIFSQRPSLGLLKPRHSSFT